jgi:hypothetical protein
VPLLKRDTVLDETIRALPALWSILPLLVAVYLNKVRGGGETSFPQLGITIHPVPGSGVLFGNLNAQRIPDPLSLHAENPVTQGEKWIAIQWIRQKEYVSRRPDAQADLADLQDIDRKTRTI